MLKSISTQFLLPNDEMVSWEELNKKINNGEIEYGIYQSYTSGIGRMMTLMFPK